MGVGLDGRADGNVVSSRQSRAAALEVGVRRSGHDQGGSGEDVVVQCILRSACGWDSFVWARLGGCSGVVGRLVGRRAPALEGGRARRWKVGGRLVVGAGADRTLVPGFCSERRARDGTRMTGRSECAASWTGPPSGLGAVPPDPLALHRLTVRHSDTLTHL
ncbi:hypothetical protein M885DRAFT_133453 [Pelagophyceae sp. CCMP2097]|nr:hypothetical protein M885DRAFT_133453 [Pelagophyceae sp. CCMP2097]